MKKQGRRFLAFFLVLAMVFTMTGTAAPVRAQVNENTDTQAGAHGRVDYVWTEGRGKIKLDGTAFAGLTVTYPTFAKIKGEGTERTITLAGAYKPLTKEDDNGFDEMFGSSSYVIGLHVSNTSGGAMELAYADNTYVEHEGKTVKANIQNGGDDLLVIVNGKWDSEMNNKETPIRFTYDGVTYTLDVTGMYEKEDDSAGKKILGVYSKDYLGWDTYTGTELTTSDSDFQNLKITYPDTVEKEGNTLRLSGTYEPLENAPGFPGNIKNDCYAIALNVFNGTGTKDSVAFTNYNKEKSSQLATGSAILYVMINGCMDKDQTKWNDGYKKPITVTYGSDSYTLDVSGMINSKAVIDTDSFLYKENETLPEEEKFAGLEVTYPTAVLDSEKSTHNEKHIKLSGTYRPVAADGTKDHGFEGWTASDSFIIPVKVKNKTSTGQAVEFFNYVKEGTVFPASTDGALYIAVNGKNKDNGTVIDNRTSPLSFTYGHVKYVLDISGMTKEGGTPPATSSPSPSNPGGSTGGGGGSSNEPMPPASPSPSVDPDSSAVTKEDGTTVTTDKTVTTQEDGSTKTKTETVTEAPDGSRKTESIVVERDGAGNIMSQTVTKEAADAKTGAELTASVVKDESGRTVESKAQVQAGVEKVSTGAGEVKLQASIPEAITKILDETASEAGAAVSVTIRIPEEAVKQQIMSGDIKTVKIDVSIPGEIGENSRLGEPAVKVGGSVLTAARESRTDLVVTVKKEGSKPYTWTFEKESLEGSGRKAKDVTLSVEIKQASQDKAVKRLVKKDKNNSTAVVVSFAHDGVLPAQAKVRLYVGAQKSILPGGKVYVYHVDPDNGKYNQLAKTIYTVSPKGYVTLSLVHCSDYVVLPNKPAATVVKRLINQVRAEASLTLAKGTTKAVKVTLPAVLERTKSLKAKTSQSTIKQAVITFRSADRSIASVSKDGTVKAVKKGTTVVKTTVTLYNGEKKTFSTKIRVK